VNQVHEGMELKEEDLVGSRSGLNKQKGVTAETATPRNDLVAGARFELATFGL
jgi:hypothetical protein